LFFQAKLADYKFLKLSADGKDFVPVIDAVGKGPDDGNYWKYTEKETDGEKVEVKQAALPPLLAVVHVSDLIPMAFVHKTTLRVHDVSHATIDRVRRCECADNDSL
jgi:hypothetical protein